MISFVNDWQILDAIAKANPMERQGFDAESICQHPNLIIGRDDDLAVFEYESNGVYTGHYFFNSARGREAVRLGKQILTYLFTNSDAVVVKGLTPISLKHALWMNRQLGFKSYGLVETFAGSMELFILTKKEFNE